MIKGAGSVMMSYVSVYNTFSRWRMELLQGLVDRRVRGLDEYVSHFVMEGDGRCVDMTCQVRKRTGCGDETWRSDDNEKNIIVGQKSSERDPFIWRKDDRIEGKWERAERR